MRQRIKWRYVPKKLIEYFKGTEYEYFSKVLICDIETRGNRNRTICNYGSKNWRVRPLCEYHYKIYQKYIQFKKGSQK